MTSEGYIDEDEYEEDKVREFAFQLDYIGQRMLIPPGRMARSRSRSLLSASRAKRSSVINLLLMILEAVGWQYRTTSCAS
jgi:hypothetical protein